MILGFGAFEKVKLYEARHLFRMSIARQPDALKSSFGAFHFDLFIAMNIVLFSCSPWVYRKAREDSPDYSTLRCPACQRSDRLVIEHPENDRLKLGARRRALFFSDRAPGSHPEGPP